MSSPFDQYGRYNALWEDIWASEQRSAKGEGRRADPTRASMMLESIVSGLVGPLGTTMPENVERNLKFAERPEVGGPMPEDTRGIDLDYGARGRGTMTVPSRFAPSRTQMRVWGQTPYIQDFRTQGGATTFMSPEASEAYRDRYRSGGLADRIRRRRGGY